MTQTTIDQSIQDAIQHQQAGRLAEAEAIFRQILSHNPNHVEALYLLGVLARRAGRLDSAVELLRQAVRICPTNASYQNDLCMALRRKGQLDEAIAAGRQAIRLKPDFTEAHCNLGNALTDKGLLDEAIASHRQAIRLKPELAVAHSNLGDALMGKGQLDEAITCYRQALRLEPGYAEAHNNLGNALKDKGQLDEAVAAYQQAIRLKPDFAAAYCNLGVALHGKGQLDEAIAACRQAVRLNPDFAEAHSNLGNALQSKGQLDEAIVSHRQAIRLKPDFAGAHSNLGNALKNQGQLDEAIASFRQAIRLQPDHALAHNNLGGALIDKRQLDEAIAACRQAIRLKPDLAEAHYNVGITLQRKRQIDEAIAAYRQAIRLKPDYADAHNNLGNTFWDKGQLDEAIVSFRRAMRLKPDDAGTHSNLVLTLHYHPGYDGRMIHEELCRWNLQHAEPLKKFIRAHTNSRDPDRRLRIGYISPDFRDCVVAPSLLPLLREHDHRQMEIFCYANVLWPDTRTDQLRSYTDIWRSVVGLSNSQAVDLIRQDGIDILVDLALHTGENRLLIFAHKPAPVQATWLGYCGSTGLDAMDYRMSDPYLDPSDSDLSLYSERTIRLPETYWCYGVSGPTPDPSPPPAAAAGYVTFGSLNNFVKASPPALDLWAEILQGMPRSRLIMHCHPGSHVDAVRERFAGKGISPDRLEFPSRQPWPQYVQTYGRIDIALDPFPWGGGITTCDALWMGVPVVSLVGRTAVGRGGASILTNVGLPELIAQTPQQYVQIATDLAMDLPRLAELRRTLRARMQASPLMDAPRFARNIEAAYRQMWRNWCAAGEGA